MTATRAAAQDIHTTLTLEDRDLVDTPEQAAAVDEAAILDVLDIIREDINMVTATLTAADARREAGGVR